MSSMVAQGIVTQSMVPLARLLYQDAGQGELADVDLSRCARALEMPLCDARSLLRRMLDNGVFQGVLRESGECRLRRGVHVVYVYSALGGADAEFLRAVGLGNGQTQSVKVGSTRPEKSEIVVTAQQYQVALVLRSEMGPEGEVNMRRLGLVVADQVGPVLALSTVLNQLRNLGLISWGRGQRTRVFTFRKLEVTVVSADGTRSTRRLDARSGE